MTCNPEARAKEMACTAASSTRSNVQSSNRSRVIVRARSTYSSRSARASASSTSTPVSLYQNSKLFAVLAVDTPRNNPASAPSPPPSKPSNAPLLSHASRHASNRFCNSAGCEMNPSAPHSLFRSIRTASDAPSIGFTAASSVVSRGTSPRARIPRASLNTSSLVIPPPRSPSPLTHNSANRPPPPSSRRRATAREIRARAAAASRHRAPDTDRTDARAPSSPRASLESSSPKSGWTIASHASSAAR
mmetsp:Transcript_95/g.385  ORF Transcript_95/g.385 Transcript_95/m.385 type:complete len:247 (-) Transcript_95:25-765(-)